MASVECLSSESEGLIQVQAGVSASGASGLTPAEVSRQVRTLAEQVRGRGSLQPQCGLILTPQLEVVDKSASAHTGTLGLASLIAATPLHSRLGNQLSS